MTSSWIVRRLALTACLLGSWSLLSAQAVRSRILEEINPNNLVELPGSVNPRIAPQFRIGSMSPSTAIHGITLYFQPTAEQKAEMAALVQAQQTPGSPEYHQWLTPAEYADRFGMSEADLGKVETWLESQGFNIDRVANSRSSISFSGTVEQVETAFQTDMGQYRINGKTHWANATNLSIPAALSGIVQSVRNLDDFRPHPMTRPAHLNSATIRPAYTDGNLQYYFMTPDDVATIYDISPAYSAGYTGSGVTIAVVGQSAISTADIEAFQTAAGLTVKDPTITLVPGTGTSTVVSGDESESDLDLEYSGAIARGASIHFVYVGNDQNYSVFDALQYAVDNEIGSVISISYGACEATMDSTDFSAEETILQEGALQGQSIIASAGDTGSTGCYGVTDAGLTTAQQEALAVNYPASSEYATGVGGTEFPTADVTYPDSQYWNSTNSSGGGSAKSYIPETAWNDDTTCAADAGKDTAEALCSGGGGASAYASRPSWQTGVTGIPSGTKRLVPDLSLDSSNVNAPYLFCTSDTSSWSNGQKNSCNSGFLDSVSGYPTAAGGTSFAAPIFAGMVAIIDQETNSEQGVAASELYKLAANGSTYASAFHDITSGGNNCTAGSSYCSGSALTEYMAGTGYDEATGLGSVDFYNLLTAWSGSTLPVLAATTTTVSAQTTNLTAGNNDTISITVAPTSGTGTPTGSVEIEVNGADTASPTLSGGTASYTFSSTVNGTYTIAAVYGGDSNFQGSTGTVIVVVTGGTTAASFTLSANPTTITTASGSSGSSTVTVTSQSGYAGTVDFGNGALAVTSSNASSLETYGCYALSSSTDAQNGSVTVAANGTGTTTLTLYTSESACSSSSGSLRPGMYAIRVAGTSGGSADNRSPFGGAVPIGASVLGGLLLFGLRRKRSKLWTLLGCLMLMVALGGFASGCGGSSGTVTTTTSNNVPAGTYSLTLTGQDSNTASLTSSVNLTLTVTQ